MTLPIALSGSPGSPYTRKMLAVLRYRRLPYRLIVGRSARDALPQPPVPLLPTFYLPDASGELKAVTDSSPIIRRLEREHAGRAVLPADPALALLDALLEDFGDEWLTKAMFHYRWAYADDIDKSARVLPNWFDGPRPDAEIAAMSQAFSQRQIGRLRYVGSNPVTAPAIEGGYRAVLGVLQRHLAQWPFLLGRRPGVGDFGFYGQLTQLAAFDPTPMALAVREAPRVVAWTLTIEDLTGLEPTDSDWLDITALPPTVAELLGWIGRLYAPLLRANARALAAGAESFETTIEGQPWQQQSFAYHGKCLRWLREGRSALGDADCARFDAAIAGSGCEALFAPL